MNCPRCGNRHMDRTQDGDLDCWNCGNVVYLAPPVEKPFNDRLARLASSNNVRRGGALTQIRPRHAVSG